MNEIEKLKQEVEQDTIDILNLEAKMLLEAELLEILKKNRDTRIQIIATLQTLKQVNNNQSHEHNRNQ